MKSYKKESLFIEQRIGLQYLLMTCNSKFCFCLSFSVSVFVSVSLSLSVSVFVCFSVSVSVSLFVCVRTYLPYSIGGISARLAGQQVPGTHLCLLLQPQGYWC